MALHTFSCNGKLLATDTECGLVSDICMARLDSSSSRYVTGQAEGAVCLRDSSTGQSLCYKKTNRVAVTAVSLSADEATVFAGRADGELVIMVVRVE
jgi:hypothetical protein